MGLHRVTQSSTHGSYNIPLISIANLVGGGGGGGTVVINWLHSVSVSSTNGILLQFH